MIQEELKLATLAIEKEDKTFAAPVEIIDNQLAKVYANSIKGMVMLNSLCLLSAKCV